MDKINSNNALIVFQGQNIRRKWYNDEWYFSVSDMIATLTGSKDALAYWRKLKQREPQLVTICHSLKLASKDNKLRNADCINTKNAFRLIQSIPSKNAEYFKIWLAQVGYERVQEIENPELAQQRMKELYEQKGYSKEWIEKRLRGIAVRQELTDEWIQRGVNQHVEFSILTNEISKATFEKTVGEYKAFKNLKRENLRDHMTDLELIFSMLGEASTTTIARSKNAKGFDENKETAKKGGVIAGNARSELEKESGKKVIDDGNYLKTPEKVKRLEKK